MKTKNFLNLKSWLLMMLMLIGAGGNLWADEVTFTPGTDTGNTSVTKDGVTATMTTMDNASYYQIYANQSATFIISDGTITKIEFTCTAKDTSKYGPGNASANVGSYSYSGTVGTWSGSATSVTISSTAQVRMTSLTVTYTKDASSVTPPTFSPESGVYLGPQTVEISCTTAEATIYYTTDGTEPTTESNVYSSAFSITPDATVKAIAVKNGVSSDVAVAEYIMGTADLAIDFEKVLEAYTAWNFTKVNRFEETSTCGAHSGSYYAGNSSGSGGTETASIQTKETVDNPDKFTCYISKYTSNTKTSTWYIQVSSDGSTWTDVATRDATNMAVGTWVEFSADLSSYSDVYVRLYYEGSTAIRCVDDITLTLRDESKQDVTLSFPQTTYEATMGSEFTAPAASAEPTTVTGIEYSSSNTSVATVDANTGAVTLVAAGTTTITATFAGDEEYNGASASYTLNVAKDPNANDGSAEKPYTVAEARAVIDAGTGLTGVYVKGIVSKIVTAYNAEYGNISYDISVDGSTTADQLRAYRGKSYNGEKFTSENNIEVGDQVVIYGNLTKYNSTYELDANNKLISNDHGDAVFSFGDETEFEVALNKSFTAPALSKGKYDGTVVYESSNTNVATVATDGTVTLVGLGETTITASGARTSAYHTPTPASYTLTVVDAVWTVEPQASEGGTVSIDGKVITATPAEGYRISKTDPFTVSGTAEVAQEGNIFTVTPASDCTVTINFEKIPEHNVVWSINGEETSTTALEDAAVEFPAAPEAIEGKTFVGWVTEAINDETDEAPTFVTSATMATSDLKYYAVFADAEEGEEETATLTANSSWSSYVEKTVTDDKGNDWTGLISGQNNSGVYHYGLNKTAHLSSPSFSGNIKEIKIVATNGSSKDRTFTFKDGETEVGTLLVSKNTTDKELSAVLNGTSFRQFTLTASDALQFTSIAVTYGGATYSGYCTTVIKPVATFNGQKYESLQAALDAAEAANPENIVIDLLDDAELTIAPRSDRLAIGTATTKSITINGNDHKLAFMTTDTDWNDVSTRNDDQTKLVLNDMTIDQGGKNTGKTWNSYDINFNCAVELNNVTSNRPIAFKNDATLKDVTISDTSGDYYGIWISPRVEGQNISIDGLTLTAGRGIKIDDEYVDAPVPTNLDIKNATFNTTKKAAILVKNAAATSITAGEGINIENVAADKTNAVWVDEDYANSYGLVSVAGATMAPESSEADYAAKIVSGDKPMGYYKTFAAAVAAAEADQVVALLKDVETYALADGQTLKVDKNGHNIAVTVPEGYALNEDIEGNVTTYSAFAGIIISNVDELKAFRDAVNAGTSYAGKTVKLAADLDLSGEANWEPIGNVADYPGKAFKGTFDGAGHTISHLTIDDQTVNWGRAALFGSASNATIKNLNITDVDIKSHHYASAIVAYKGDGTNVTIENCHVKNGSIVSTPELLSSGSYDNGDKVGAILGYGANPTTIDGCSAENINISGYRDLGSIAGYITGTVTNCTAKDVTIVQDNTNGYKDGDMLATCGEIVGGRSTNAATVNAESSYDNVVILQTGLVAQIGTVKYRTLAQAVAAVPADGTETTITMIDNEMVNVVGYAITIPSTKNVVIDLNAFQVVGTAGEAGTSALIRNLGTLTIKDSSDTKKDGTGTGKLISGASPTWTWDGTDDYSGSYASNLIRNEKDLIVESGLLYTMSKGSAAYAIDNYSAGNITINGGKVDAAKASAIRMFYVNGGSITVNDGVVGHYNSDGDYSYMGIQVMSGTNVNVSVAGGTIAGSYALYANNTGGSLAISGGIFDGYVGIAAAVPNDILSISGGTFNEWVGTWGDQTKFISGGTYSMKPDAEYIADGYIAAQQGNVYVVIPESDMPSAPTIFHDEGTYEGTLDVAIAGQGTIMYKLGDSEAQVYSAPFEISETTKVTAWAEQDGIKSAEVSKTFTIVTKPAGPSVTDGYYTIKTNEGKFVNVAGRKTVTLVENADGMPGTVIRVKATNGKVETLRSQGVDVPSYVQKAMNYVPEIVRLAVDKLHAEGAGELLGTTGYDKIIEKFNESFDYNLYLEGENNTYRIYGRTPSMKPVVDFYAENKANVDAKLPELEEFINKAIQKVLEKTGGRGKSILVDFSLQTVWQKMGGTLTEPTDEASTAKFYEEVLTSEANVWNFAYQTAMIYWGNLKNNETFKNNLINLGDYAKYIDKVENIRPNFKYFIVPSASGVDFISEGNIAITGKDPSVAWTMEPVSKFNVEIPETNKVGDKYYTTLYTDFAYTLPEGVKAMKVTSIGESGCYGYAETEEIDAQSIAEQTPILLVSETAGSKTLELSKTGSAVTDNLLKGPDYLISEYKIKTPQVESLFDMAKSILGESAYKTYLEKYEHLMLKNAGTVGNKYFFGLSKDECKEVDVNVCVLENVAEFGTIFASDKENINANKAFLVSDIYTEIRLMKAGDVNRDGKISIADVTALVNIILGKVTEENNPDNFDFGAADVNCDTKRTIADVTALVNIILGKPNN